MMAGGLGAIAASQTHKIEFAAGTLLIQLGGPGMRIGMGGGAASSMAAGANAAELDFDSVQRGNPEIERRAQEVINHCCALGDANPILAIHDVGAGGLSNAFPELVEGAGRGARFDLRRVPLEESGLAPKEIWCNESQERYVIALAPESLPAFRAICERERCPFAVVGVATEAQRLVLGAIDLDTDADGERGELAIDMPIDVLLGKPPKLQRDVQRVRRTLPPLDLTGVPLARVAFDVLRHPTVASKRFLITIGDRTVGGLTHRDQMVGPWQVPVADCAVTLADYQRLSRRGDERSASARRSHCSMRRRRAAWRSARRSPTCSRRRSSSAASSSAATGWRPAATTPPPRATTRRCSTPSARSAWNSARRWASASRSARTACRCARAGATAESRSRSARRSA